MPTVSCDVHISVSIIYWSCDTGVCSRSQQLETDLKIEREWRQTLQNDLDRERGTVAQLSTEALQIKLLKQVKPTVNSLS